MPRSGARLRHSSNEVVKRIEAGSGKIAGLQLLAAVDDLALMPVRVEGIRFGGDARHGVTIKVTPVGGHGFLFISPTNLIDNTPAAIDLFERKCKANERWQAVRDARNDALRRKLIVDMRTEMTADQRKDFDKRLPDRIGEKATKDPVAALNKLSGEWEAKGVAELAAKVLFSVMEADEYDD